jgi:hypothetical protein
MFGAAVLIRRRIPTRIEEEPPVRRTATYLLRAAGLLLGVFLLLGLVPTRGVAVEYVRPNRDVICGSVFVANEWTNDDGCEKSILARMAWMGGALALSLLAGIGGGVLLVVSRDIQRARDRREGGQARFV